MQKINNQVELESLADSWGVGLSKISKDGADRFAKKLKEAS